MIDVIERASDNGFRVYKDNNAGVQLGGPRQPYVWDDQFHEWKITFTPTGFTFSVDGVQMADVADLTYRGGYLSFWCYTGSNQAPQGQNMFVDDIRIEFGSSYCPTITPAVGEQPAREPEDRLHRQRAVRLELHRGLLADRHEHGARPSRFPSARRTGRSSSPTPRARPIVQTFEAECLSPGTTEFVLTAEGAVCPNAMATFTVREPGLPEYCEHFAQADGAPEGWTVYSGSWQVAGEKLVGSCAAGGTPTARRVDLGREPARQVRGRRDVRVLGRPDPDDAGRRRGPRRHSCSSRALRSDRGLISGYEIDWIGRASDHGYRCLRYDNGDARRSSSQG